MDEELKEARQEAAASRARAAKKTPKASPKPRAGKPPKATEEQEGPRAQAAARREAAKRERTYVVKSGDSLSKIAGELLGDYNRWPEIFEANKDKIKDPNLIYPGQEFVIPPK